ncbi:GAF domain-containing protein [Deinococcus ruber]|uniref:histidine kinase n=1 Tax=Deinococcus ruber TaxID=1848197 RepID=A0A918FIN1_9DEIO|nr:GAF domain-containing protein [Deinococcus ruber]GGR40065.1 hypothetical protein GCM10008957_55830 [Deinococcus ruber]
MSDLSAVETPAPTSLSEHLQQVTEAIAATHTQAEVLRIVLHPALAALNAIAGAVLLIDPTGTLLQLAATEGHEAGAQTIWQGGPLDGNVPAGAALEQQRPMFFEHQGALVQAYPELETRTGAVAPVASAVLPMFLDRRPLGTIILDFKEPHTFTAEEQRFLQTLAAQCSVALGRVRVTGQLQAQLQEQQRHTDGLSAFIAFTEAAGTSTDIGYLVRQAQRVLQLSIPDLMGAYYEWNDGVWRAQMTTADMPEALRQVVEAGLSAQTPSFLMATEQRQPVLLEDWNAEVQGVPFTEAFHVVGLAPYFHQGQPRFMFTAGFSSSTTWSAAQRELFLAVARGLEQALNRADQSHLQERQAALEAFVTLTGVIGKENDPQRLAEWARDLIISFLPDWSIGYYTLQGDLWKATVTRVPDPGLEALLRAGLPLETPGYAAAVETGAPVFVDGWDAEQQRFEHTESYGIAAFYPYFTAGRPSGMLVVGTQTSTVWEAADRAVFTAVGHSLGLALAWAGQAEELQAQNAALEAFTRFTEASADTTEVAALVSRAAEVLRATLGDVSVVHYDLDAARWRATAWSIDVTPEFVTLIQEGFSQDTPRFAQAVQTQQPHFVSHWDAVGEGLPPRPNYGAVAAYPYFLDGQPVSVLSVGVKGQLSWSEREQGIIRAVGRSLGLALERTRVARQVQIQQEETERRSRTLEAFALMSRDLADETDRSVILGHAQALILSMLPPGTAAYWEPAGNRWALKAQVGDTGNADLLHRMREQGLAWTAPTVYVPWTSGHPFYQDHYIRSEETPSELISHVHAGASFLVRIHGEPVGVLAVGLFDQWTWTPADTATLETAVYSLGLVLERAESVAALRERTNQLETANTELQLSNQELEAFTYSASHDLRTPVRHVMGFAELAEKALEKAPNERVGQHLKVIKQAALRMTDLIDSMLVLSRSGRQEVNVRSVDLNRLVVQGCRDAAAEFESHPIRWQIGDLPHVQGDLQLLQQVITNLLSNAVKYSAKREVSEVKVNCEAHETEWYISVEDNGVGFDPRYAQKLFGIFQRLHTEKEFKGTGVGLATVKRIVQKHRGRVFAESDGRTGATFSFTLPKLD